MWMRCVNVKGVSAYHTILQNAWYGVGDVGFAAARAHTAARSTTAITGVLGSMVALCGPLVEERGLVELAQ